MMLIPTISFNKSLTKAEELSQRAKQIADSSPHLIISKLVDILLKPESKQTQRRIREIPTDGCTCCYCDALRKYTACRIELHQIRKRIDRDWYSSNAHIIGSSLNSESRVSAMCNTTKALKDYYKNLGGCKSDHCEFKLHDFSMRGNPDYSTSISSRPRLSPHLNS